MSAGPDSPGHRDRRADARRNYDHILATAAVVLAEQGVQASLRDVARRADVGLGTLYRHFPTREALLETLLRQGFERLVELAGSLRATHPPEQALTRWLHELAAGASVYRGLPASLVATLQDPTSALFASCSALQNAGAGLVENAQQAGAVRADITGPDVFALVGAVASMAEHSAFRGRTALLLDVVIDGLKRPAGG
ncbi:DNA-binding transcriptional regulator, AcrR family [Parafrankia irregularis]|uniref:DNA-binding transcriptional regulator, AcrR family n=1 Tax=Parafrankia irregularis TaxID=795642 RepID=A0A0S4QFR9_9ACTN|nr:MULTISPECIES: TetR/AcrR family transcriptional regulator [Parafrankia]MBE3203278.1 TetR/AcrR family transcriptional regulator [Parafrankia sp. CH37]CUU54073.1 DNA-binding transcriptional regulator, AcrR family [Parafrankia irregularis]